MARKFSEVKKLLGNGAEVRMEISNKHLLYAVAAPGTQFSSVKASLARTLIERTSPCSYLGAHPGPLGLITFSPLVAKTQSS